jgi:multidrug efflux pump subunit AcrA (membrane-fusion protein)
VPLLKKQTPEEKEAERQRKEAERQRKEAEQRQQAQEKEQRTAAQAEQQRLQQEQQAAAAEAVRQHVASLAKYEYKVLTLSSAIWSSAGKFDKGGLEGTLNEHAAEGWRVIEIAMSGKIEKAFSADRNDIYIVFERLAAPARRED